MLLFEEILPYLDDYRNLNQITIIIVHEKKNEIIKMLENEGFVLDFISISTLKP
ncbi:hypothetical protein J2Y40_001974 [Chryseobacterium sp. 2987]|nr:hypothetical protein [Chryseobacterium sp. 2987]